MIKDWWADWGWIIATVVIIVVAFLLLVSIVYGMGNQRVSDGRVSDFDHQILATEISRLHDDVRLLQTQVSPKQ